MYEYDYFVPSEPLETMPPECDELVGREVTIESARSEVLWTGHTGGVRNTR
jgi:hypothetical protein